MLKSNFVTPTARKIQTIVRRIPPQSPTSVCWLVENM